MSDKNKNILDAAGRVFKRHGVAKTTMADIAAEAGVSRQTVYNLYDGRDDILRGVIRNWGQMLLATLIARWDGVESLGEKLDLFFETVPINHYDMIQNAPNMADIIDGASKVAKAELLEFDVAFKEAIAQMLAEVPDLQIGASTDDLADFIYSTAINAKYNSESRPQLIRRLQTLKACLIRS